MLLAVLSIVYGLETALFVLVYILIRVRHRLPLQVTATIIALAALVHLATFGFLIWMAWHMDIAQ
jgi:hypothetical protein